MCLSVQCASVSAVYVCQCSLRLSVQSVSNHAVGWCSLFVPVQLRIPLQALLVICPMPLPHNTDGFPCMQAIDYRLLCTCQ